jgi:alkylation response protein AidB-like acyl-CoA dehydrogenase
VSRTKPALSLTTSYEDAYQEAHTMATTLTRPPAADLLATARSLGPLIREHATDGERGRRLAREVLQAITGAGLFRLLLPKALGGHEVDPVTCSRIVEEVAGFHSAAGWALQAGNAGAWWSARLPQEGADEIYSGNPDAVMAAAFHPPQRAVPGPGGYRLSGRGPLASNIHDSEWLFLTALVMDGDQPRLSGGAPEVIALVLPVAEVQVVDTWDSLGMRATDSNDVVVDNVFVPARRTFRLTPEFQPGPRFEGPLYRFPAIGGAVFCIAPVPLAIARGAITELRALAGRKTSFGFNRPLSERPAVQATLARAEGMLRAARLLYYDTLTAAWERTLSGAGSTLEQKADILLAASYAVTTAAKVTDLVHRAAGTSGIYARSPLERHLRDALTLRHHGFLSENRFEAVGQVYLGLPPEFAMVAF